MLTKTRILLGFLGLVLYLVPTMGCHSEKVPSDDQKRAVSLEAAGVIQRDDFARILSLDHSVENGGLLSEQDTDWLLALAQSKSSDSYTNGLRLLNGSLVFKHITKRNQIPDSRRDAVYQLALKMVAYKGRPTGVPSSGCIILGNLYEKRALVPLRAMAATKQPFDVEIAVAGAIKKLSKTQL